MMPSQDVMPHLVPAGASRRGLHGVFISTAVLALALVSGVAVQGPPRDLIPGPEPDVSRDLVDLGEGDRRVRRLAMAPGEALSFRQEPALLVPRHGQGLHLAEFTVMGDLPRVRFDRWTGLEYQTETWERARSDTRGGRLVSVFEPSWPADVIQAQLALARVGLDRPFLYLGSFRGSVDNPSLDHEVLVRLGLSFVKPVEVVRIDEAVQYSSHVVNLVIRGFGDQRLDTDYDLQTVAQRFYQHFEDTYEVLAVTPEEPHVQAYSAYHLTVQNQVEGIGRNLASRHAAYGSAGALLAVEAYHGARLTDSETTTHELTHTWGHVYNWARIAGIGRAGHAPESHAPLMTGGESQIGAVLRPSRRVARRADGTAVIERVSRAAHHPLDLYAMGLIEPADIPEWEVFEQQGQFHQSTAVAPAPNTTVDGPARRVSINDVMAAHGPRRGPVHTSISRATIVVSRDRLMSAEDMAYWNYFSARQEDPTGSGVPTYGGIPSFEATTGRRIDLRTDIRPKAHPQVGQPHDVDPLVLGATDCRDVEFTQPPRARVRVGERFTVAGRVTARDRTDFHQVLVRLWPASDTESHAIRESRELGGAGTFSIDFEIREGREGEYRADVFVFWPSAGSQYPRCMLSPMVVSPAR